MKSLQKEFGKWLMDIAKYITTAVIISAVFSGVKDLHSLIVGGSIAVVLTLGWGLVLVYDRKEDKKNKKKGR